MYGRIKLKIFGDPSSTDWNTAKGLTGRADDWLTDNILTVVIVTYIMIAVALLAGSVVGIIFNN